MSELISVVVTSYNVGKYLRQCVDSVLKQTYKDIEVLIINDGSTDDTDKIAKEYVEKNGNVRYYYQQNFGVSVARNLGINNASGSYIMFVDGDDYLDEHIIEELVNNTVNSDIIFCCCRAFSAHEVYEDHFFQDSFIAQTQAEKEKLYLQLLNGNKGKPDGKGYTAVGVPWGRLYKLAFLRENHIFFDPELRRMQDNMFNLYAFCHAEKVCYLDKPLYYYRLEHIQSKNTSYGLDIWRPFLEARKRFWEENRNIITDELMNEIQYEYNISFISAILNETKNRGLTDSAKMIFLIRNNELFTILFQNKIRINQPIKVKAFYYLAKYKLYILLALCIKAF